MSYYSPEPRQKQKSLPKRTPKRVIPSHIGEKGLAGNWLVYYVKGGDHLHDFSPYKNHGVMSGVEWVSTEKGWALEFDAGDIVDMGQPSELLSSGLGDSFTLSCWIKTTQSPNVHKHFVGMRDDASNDIYVLVDRGDSNPFFYVDAVGGDVKVYLPTHNILDGNWHRLTGVYNGSDVLFYVDGQLKASGSTSGVLDSVTKAHFTLGARYNSAGSPTQTYVGKIDRVLIYDRALSKKEISLL